jgi:hypothetical protein
LKILAACTLMFNFPIKARLLTLASTWRA